MSAPQVGPAPVRARAITKKVWHQSRIDRTRANGGIAPIPPDSHGASAYTNWGCRCDSCRKGHSEHMKSSQKARRERVASGQGPTTHGLTGYKAGCRCRKCLDTGRSYQKKRRLEVATGTRHLKRHGGSGFVHGCRCDECRTADVSRRSRLQTARNDASRKSAIKHYHEWTSAEYDVAIRTDLSIGEIAELLGRTRAAVVSARRRALHDPRHSSNRETRVAS